MFIYEVRDKNTGKLLNDLTTKHKKYWDRYEACEKILKTTYKRINLEDVEIVKFELVEVKDENN